MRRLYILSMFILLCIDTASTGRGGQTTKSASDEAILERRVGQVASVDDSQIQNNTTRLFLDTLAGTGMPGGVIQILKCENKPFINDWKPEGFQLRDALDLLVLSDPTYRWTIDNGVINLLPANDEPSLLKTRIDSFEVENTTSLDTIVSKILETTQVKRSVARSNLESGLQIIVKPVPLNPRPGYSVKLKNVTLREAMNTIARIHGRAVWRYKEKECNGKNEFWLDFIVE